MCVCTCCKASTHESVITQIKDQVSEQTVNHHNCTGKDTFMVVEKFGKDVKIVRTTYAKYTCTCW